MSRHQAPNFDGHSASILGRKPRIIPVELHLPALPASGCDELREAQRITCRLWDEKDLILRCDRRTFALVRRYLPKALTWEHETELFRVLSIVEPDGSWHSALYTNQPKPV